jgi:hypothetical protein
VNISQLAVKGYVLFSCELWVVNEVACWSACSVRARLGSFGCHVEQVKRKIAFARRSKPNNTRPSLPLPSSPPLNMSQHRSERRRSLIPRRSPSVSTLPLPPPPLDRANSGTSSSSSRPLSPESGGQRANGGSRIPISLASVSQYIISLLSRLVG